MWLVTSGKTMDSMDEEDHELVFADSAGKKCFRVKKWPCYVQTVALCLLVVTVVSLAVALALVVTRGDHDKDECPTSTCRTDSCSELAKVVEDNIDTTVDPCVDFYSFSCGGWVENNPLPEGSARYSPFNKLDEENKQTLINILDGTDDDDIEAVRKLKTLYQLCLNESRLEVLGASPMLTLISRAGGWPLLNNTSVTSRNSLPISDFLNSEEFLKMKLNGNPAFFSYYVYVDDKNSSRYTVFLEQSGLTLPSPENYADDTRLSVFRNYALGILRRLNNTSISQNVYENAVDNIIQLEKELANIFVSVVDLRDPEATYNNMTINELDMEFPDTFNWTFTFQRSFSIARAPSILTSEVVIVRTLSYFKKLSQVLSQMDGETLRNYVMWQYIKEYVPFLSQDFLDEYYKFTQAVYGVGQRDRNETCLALVQGALPIALARPYTEYVLPGGTKEVVEGMISQVKKAFKERVNSSSWLVDSTKKKCDEKVDAVTQRVAYPDLIYHDPYLNRLYENYTLTESNLLLDMAAITLEVTYENLWQLHSDVDKTEWDIAPTAVNAYYNPSFNQFTFLEGILAPPFIKANWPDYFTYGAFGVVVGHELTHGFDDQGQQYDKDGNLQPWWDPTSTLSFKNRQKCFVNQYSSYQLFGMHVNGNLTLGENLADNGGLKTSYQAYKNIAELEGVQSHLPGLEYTPDQLFFIAFAQVWCSIFTEEYIATSLLTNPHSPGPFRVNGTLINSQEFADAFNCPVGSPMNPKDKCLMW